MDPAPMTAEEESLKKNTDCIYFLASPLTCKKGALCEFRHSDSARLNPRDCYYWLSGNCLNPKCGFRHPPLDALKANSVPSTAPAASIQIPTAISAKQSTPCIYFQKGHCLKAERCPFSHVTQQVMPHNTAKVSPSTSENQEALKKEPWSMKQCATQHNISNPFIDIVSKTPVPLPKPINGYSHAKSLPSKPSHVTNSNARSIGQNQQIQIQNYSHEDAQNGLEPGEIAGEHYSGFDSNVSNNLKRQNHSDYERYTSAAYQKSHIERNDNNKRHVSAAYERTRIEQNGRSAHGFYERKPQRISSEMNSERSRLPYRRSRSPDDVTASDLRYRLKQRKIDSSDSSRYRVSNGSSRSSHIKDRISGLEKEREVSRIRGRLSPTRRHERVRRSSEEPIFSAKSRNINSRLSKREDINDSVNFSGPKTLAELKGKKKQAERSHLQESGVRKAVSYEEIVETGPTFEGPKPLDVLLKKKRGEGSANSSGETNKINETKEDGKVEEYFEEIAGKEEKPTAATKDDEDNNEGESVVKEEEDNVEEYEDYNMEVDGAEDQDLENFDGEYEEYYDESVYQEDEVKLNDGDNNDNDIDDEDEFARKIGLIFS